MIFANVRALLCMQNVDCYDTGLPKSLRPMLEFAYVNAVTPDICVAYVNAVTPDTCAYFN